MIADHDIATVMRLLREQMSLELDCRIARLLPRQKLVKSDMRGALAPIPRTVLAPWRHQLQAFHFARERNGAILALCVGGGKTKVVNDLAANMERCRLILVIAPKAVTLNWPREIAKHYPSADDVTICLPDPKATVARRAQQVQAAIASAGDRVVFIILNHDAARMEPLAGVLKAITWDIVALDEAHKICDPSTQLAKLCYKLKARKRLALTGTPYKQTPVDVFGIARWVAPRIAGYKKWDFWNKWARFDPFSNQPIGVTNPQAFDRFCSQFMITIGREVLELLPAQHIPRYVSLSASAQAKHDMLRQALNVVLAGLPTVDDDDAPVVKAQNKAVGVLKCQQVTSGFVKDDAGVYHEVDTSKAEALGALFDELPPGEPVTVVCRFTHDIQTVKRIAAEHGRVCLEESGQRHEWQQFADGAGDTLAVQIDAGSEGIDLTRAAVMIFYSIGYKLVAYTQILARVHRPGQERHVTYFHLIAQGSIDEQVYHALSRRQSVIAALQNFARERLRAA